MILSMKYFYSIAGSDDLVWILAPTAYWTGLLSGIPFAREAAGYVNHSLHFIIAPSCSGVQFMLITFATLVFSFLHRRKTKKSCFLWMLLCLGISYLFTVFVNGIRIVLSIYLPIYLARFLPAAGGRNTGADWLTPGRLHTMIGITVYFVSLLTIYRLTDAYSGKKAQIYNPRFLLPAFWYFSITLGLPFLNRAYQTNGKSFTEYALLVVFICMIILCFFRLGGVLKAYLKH